jgi:RNA polymerase sigma factor (sigma-70 family)
MPHQVQRIRKGAKPKKFAKKSPRDKAKILAEWELVRRYQDSNEAALRELLEKLGIYDSSGQIRCDQENFVYRFFSKCSCTRNDAENFTQEIVVRLVTALKRFEYKAAVKTFIHRICLNTYLEQVRRKHIQYPKVIVLIQIFLHKISDPREKTLPVEILDTMVMDEPEQSALDRLITEERKEIMRKCIAKLPNENWRLVASLRLAGLTFKQIAKVLHRTLGAVNGWWARAFAFLQKCAQASEAGENNYAVPSGK